MTHARKTTSAAEPRSFWGSDSETYYLASDRSWWIVQSSDHVGVCDYARTDDPRSRDDVDPLPAGILDDDVQATADEIEAEIKGAP